MAHDDAALRARLQRAITIAEAESVVLDTSMLKSEIARLALDIGGKQWAYVLAVLREVEAVLASGVPSPIYEDVLAHWFTQGGVAQFGELGTPQNADELVAAILERVRPSGVPSPPQETKIDARVDGVPSERPVGSTASSNGVIR